MCQKNRDGALNKDAEMVSNGFSGWAFSLRDDCGIINVGPGVDTETVPPTTDPSIIGRYPT